MTDILELTTILDTCDQLTRQHSVNDRTTSIPRDEDVVTEWLEYGTNDRNHRAISAYHTFRNVLTGQVKDTDSLIGEPSRYVDPLLIPLLQRAIRDTPDNRAKSVVAKSIYLNSYGLFHEDEFIDAIVKQTHADRSTSVVDKGEITHDVEQTTCDESATLLDFANNVNADTFTRHINNDTTNANSNSANRQHMLGQDAADYDYMIMQVQDVLVGHTLSMEEIMNELYIQVILPQHNIDAFESAISAETYTEIDTIDDSDLHHLLHVISRTNHTCDRMQLLRQELYSMCLPARYRMDDIDITPVMDVIANQLLGASGKFIKDIMEVASFTNYVTEQGIMVTKEVLETIMKTDTVDHSAFLHHAHIEWVMPDVDTTTRYADVLLDLFRRHSCFIVFLELVRKSIPQLIDLTIGFPDECEGTIKPFHIYFHKNNFYLSVVNGDSDTAVVRLKSTCYKQLLAAAHAAML